MLGLLNPSPASSGPRDELREPLSAPEPEKPVTERCPTRIETPLDSPPLPVPQTTSSVPSSLSPTQSSHMVPEPVEFEVVNNASQAPAATSSSKHLDHLNIVRPSQCHTLAFQEATSSSASQVQTFDLRTQNGFSPGSTKDVNMEFLGEATIEPPVYATPTMWTSSQSQPEQIYYSQVDQVADNMNQYQTHHMYNIHANWASMASIPSSDVKLGNYNETICSQCKTHPWNNSAK